MQMCVIECKSGQKEMKIACLGEATLGEGKA